MFEQKAQAAAVKLDLLRAVQTEDENVRGVNPPIVMKRGVNAGRTAVGTAEDPGTNDVIHPEQGSQVQGGGKPQQAFQRAGRQLLADHFPHGGSLLAREVGTNVM